MARMAVASAQALAAVLIICGCGGDDPEPKAGPRPSPSTSPGPSPSLAAEPIAFGTPPLWTGRGAPDGIDNGFTLVGDALVHVTHAGEDEGGHRMVVKDAATGRQRWSIGRDDPVGDDGAVVDFVNLRPEIIGPDEDWLVLALYEKPVTRVDGSPGREMGVVALSGREGSPRWTIPVFQDRLLSGPVSTRPWLSLFLHGADDELVMVRVTTFRIGADRRAEKVEQHAVALDVESRRPRWEAPGIASTRIVDGVILGEIPVDVPTNPGEADATTVVGLDPDSGEVRWNLDDRYTRSSLHTHLGGYALVNTFIGARYAVHAVDTGSGGDLTELSAPARVARCAADTALAACQADSRLRTYQPDGGAHSVALEPEGGALVVYRVWRGRIFAEGLDGNVVIDRLGNRLAEDLPGQIEAINDGYAVFRTNFGDPEFEVYRVTG